MLARAPSIASLQPATGSHCRLLYAPFTAAPLRGPRIQRVVRVHAEQQKSEQEPGSSSSQQQSQQQQEELPIWVRREKERELQAAASKKELPWPLYLLSSVIVAIASVGSIFEYFDHNAVFGVIPPDSPLWAPVLGLFAFSGLPMAGFLFFKGVNAANEAAERQDKLDGYIK